MYSVVAIRGGTGLCHLLMGLREYPLDLTAVVSVADDGGSTGRIWIAAKIMEIITISKEQVIEPQL
ncbi:hypothetical protein A2V68_02190 [candidate division Kazan bacterium RBG_13_50_9]|uniref:Uncharacterized protein n=1 Tax=candidate division Kazan bacterium RBG_13_50_9 TaxID=1798535 RepID=A0A1F4NTA9_UNCK3|nr:MAG: hypothetical protein A2V68_02190 [candidate division Kazan bacterium RBG_13_50_9]